MESDLRGAGYSVAFRSPIETKSAAGAAQDVVLRILGTVEDHVIEVIVAYVLLRLRGLAKIGPRRGNRRRAAILGPDGQVLRQVELPEKEAG